MHQLPNIKPQRIPYSVRPWHIYTKIEYVGNPGTNAGLANHINKKTAIT